MKDVKFDLSSVPPRKLEEARRRAAVVAEFAKIERPTKLLAEAYAARLGIRTGLFYMLVKLYREQGTIVRHPSVGLAERTLRMDPRVDAAIEAAIRTVGPDATLADATAAAHACCKALGLPHPSETAVRTRLRRARRHGGGSQSYPPLVLDRSALELNVETEHGPKAAWLSALVYAPTATVLGHHVSVGSAGAREAAFAVLDAIGDDGARPLPDDVKGGAIALFRDHRPDWQTLTDILSSADLIVVGPVKPRVRLGTAFYRLLGDRMARIPFRPRLPADAEARDGGPGVSLQIARNTVRQALAAHGALALPDGVDVSAQMQLPLLASDLKRFAAKARVRSPAHPPAAR